MSPIAPSRLHCPACDLWTEHICMAQLDDPQHAGQPRCLCRAHPSVQRPDDWLRHFLVHSGLGLALGLVLACTLGGCG